MQKNIAFIGCGNMGQAILNGLITGSGVNPQHITVYTPTAQNVQRLQQRYAINPANSYREALQQADIVIMAMKPHQIIDAICTFREHLSHHALLISLAAGVTMQQLAAVCNKERKIIRAMPNTPALVGAAMTSLSANRAVSEQDMTEICTLFRGFGAAEQVDEALIHAVVGVSGSAPAYIYMIIEAMADGAVLGGMPRQQAYRFAAQAVLGAAKMVLESGSHPALLKDQVCSPAGTTIEAVKALEQHGIRAAIIEAVSQSMEKSRRMSG